MSGDDGVSVDDGMTGDDGPSSKTVISCGGDPAENEAPEREDA
jgi:hypothetical protein